MQGQKILNELEFEKFLDELDDVKGKLDIFQTIEPEGVNEIEEKGEGEKSNSQWIAVPPRPY